MQFCKKSVLNYKANPILKFGTSERYGSYKWIDMPLLEQIGWLGNAHFVLFVTLLLYKPNYGSIALYAWGDVLEDAGYFIHKYGSKEEADNNKRINEFIKDMELYDRKYGKYTDCLPTKKS